MLQSVENTFYIFQKLSVLRIYDASIITIIILFLIPLMISFQDQMSYLGLTMGVEPDLRWKYLSNFDQKIVN